MPRYLYVARRTTIKKSSLELFVHLRVCFAYPIVLTKNFFFVVWKWGGVNITSPTLRIQSQIQNWLSKLEVPYTGYPSKKGFTVLLLSEPSNGVEITSKYNYPRVEFNHTPFHFNIQFISV